MITASFIEGVVLVDREVIAVSPRPQSKSAVLPLRPSKYSPCSIRVQVRKDFEELLLYLIKICSYYYYLLIFAAIHVMTSVALLLFYRHIIALVMIYDY